MRILFFMLFSVFVQYNLSSQETSLTLEKIWASSDLSFNKVSGFDFQKKGGYYTRLNDGSIEQYDIATGKFVKNILVLNDSEKKDLRLGVEGYKFSDNENKILIYTNAHKIYRHSFYAKYFVYDLEDETLAAVDEDLIRNAHFSPNGKKVAYVKENNLYCKDLVSKKSKKITHDGVINSVINGVTDWVYEEEFSFDRAFEWSSDNNHIAFIRFDESEVHEYTMTYHDNRLYPNYHTFKYPKVGEKNSDVSVHAYNIKENKIVEFDLKIKNKDFYIPRIKWTKDPSELCITYLDRDQKSLKLFLGNVEYGKTRILLEEEEQAYVDITDDLYFLDDKKHFLWRSEADGYSHIYLHNILNKEIEQLTTGPYDVTDVYGVDEVNRVVYFQSADIRPENRGVRKVSINSGDITELHIKDGWSEADFSSDYSYRVVTHSTVNEVPTYKVYDRHNKLARVIEDNLDYTLTQKENGSVPFEFFDFETSEQIKLNGWMLKPELMVKGQKYPVLMFVYGGPNSQRVTNKFSASYHWWFQYLTQLGYVVACVDNRGTGARGEEFRKMTQLQLGKYETIDQIEAAKYLGSLAYIDADRIGIFGWSYGGYLSTLCILKGSDVFKSAIAVAPVTNWRWYDSVYTERFMGTEKNNADGYKNNSPVYFADRLKGNYLIAHGTGDDNVHFQNTVEMVDALINNNKDFDMCFYPNKNHGIYGGYTRLHLFRKMTNFIKDKI